MVMPFEMIIEMNKKHGNLHIVQGIQWIAEKTKV